MQVDDLLLVRGNDQTASFAFNTAIVSDDIAILPFYNICIGQHSLLDELEHLMHVVILRVDRLP